MARTVFFGRQPLHQILRLRENGQSAGKCGRIAKRLTEFLFKGQRLIQQMCEEMIVGSDFLDVIA